MPTIERGNRELLESIEAKIDALTLGTNPYQTDGPETVVPGTEATLAVNLFADTGEPCAVGDIVVGTHEVYRIRGGVTTQIVAGTPNVKITGRAYFTYDFPIANWAVGDMFFALFFSIVRDGAAVPTQVLYGTVTDEFSVLDVYNEVTSADHGLDVIKDAIDGLALGTGGASVAVAKEQLANTTCEDTTNWTALGTAVISASTDQCRSETKSLKVVISANNDGAQQLYGEIRGAGYYRGCAYIFNGDAVNRNVTVEFARDGAHIYSQAALLSAGRWNKVEKYFETDASIADPAFKVWSDDNAPWTLYIDDPSVKLLNEPDLYTPIADIKADTAAIRTLQEGANGLAAIKGDTAALRTLAEGTSGFAAIKTRVNELATPADVNTQVANNLNAAISSGPPTAKSLRDILSKDGNYNYDKATDSLEALSDKITAVDTQTDLLADGTNGLAAIKTQTANAYTEALRAARGTGRNSLVNPYMLADIASWGLMNTSGHATKTWDNTAGNNRGSTGGVCALFGTTYDMISQPLESYNEGRKAGRYYVSAWVLCVDAGVPIGLRLFPSNVITGTTVANTWVRLEGICTVTSNGNIAINLGFWSPVTGDHTLYIKDVVVQWLDDALLDYVHRRVANKDSSLTFDPATDSLEAISDKITAAQGGSNTLETIYAKVGSRTRRYGSGITLQTADNASAKIIDKITSPVNTPFMFNAGWVSFGASAIGDKVTLALEVLFAGLTKEVVRIELDRSVARVISFPSYDSNVLTPYAMSFWGYGGYRFRAWASAGTAPTDFAYEFYDTLPA